MAFGCQIITMFEGTGAGIQWSTIAEGASPDDNLSLLDVILMLFADGFIYLLLAVYIEGILAVFFSFIRILNFERDLFMTFINVI